MEERESSREVRRLESHDSGRRVLARSRLVGPAVGDQQLCAHLPASQGARGGPSRDRRERLRVRGADLPGRPARGDAAEVHPGGEATAHQLARAARHLAGRRSVGRAPGRQPSPRRDRQHGGLGYRIQRAFKGRRDAGAPPAALRDLRPIRDRAQPDAPARGQARPTRPGLSWLGGGGAPSQVAARPLRGRVRALRPFYRVLGRGARICIGWGARRDSTMFRSLLPRDRRLRLAIGGRETSRCNGGQSDRGGGGTIRSRGNVVEADEAFCRGRASQSGRPAASPRGQHLILVAASGRQERVSHRDLPPFDRQRDAAAARRLGDA